MSIFLYNMETWSLTKNQKRFAEMRYMQLIRQAFRKKGPFTMRNRESNEAILARIGLKNFDQIHALKKIRWVTHVIRGNCNLLKQDMKTSKDDKDAWWMTYVRALEAVQMKHELVVDRAREKVNWEKIITEMSSKPNGSDTNTRAILIEDQLEFELLATGMTD